MQKGKCLLAGIMLCVMLIMTLCAAGAAKQQKMPAGTVWFNEREADLEKPALKINGQLYITFTDLVRHLGGTLTWGPNDSYVEGTRGDIVIRVSAGNSYVHVNETKTPLKSPVRRIGNRTYVPLEPLCALFGAAVEHDNVLHRVYVS